MAMRSDGDGYLSNGFIAVLAVLCVAMTFFSGLVFTSFSDRGCWALTMDQWDLTADCWDAWTVGAGSAGIAVVLAIFLGLSLYFDTSRNRYVVLLGATSLTAFVISALLGLKVLVSVGDAGCWKSDAPTETVRAGCKQRWLDLWMLWGLAIASFAGVLRSLYLKSRSNSEAGYGHV